MLCLTRRVKNRTDEATYLGDTVRLTHLGAEITVTFSRARGGKVRLNIEAPLAVRIERPDAKRKVVVG